MRLSHGLICPVVALALLAGTASGEETYESVEKSSVYLYDLAHVLRPFVATCSRETTHFRKLFCSGLNDRLKAQHQAKVYRTMHGPSETGPLVVRFKAKPSPALELEVRGCLTCDEPFLERAGGDVSAGRFFVLKMPPSITIRRGKHPYDLGDITIATYRVELPADTTEKTFQEQILPHLRLEILLRPVAGVTMVGTKRYKYGVINFEIAGHRVVHKCAGKTYGAAPKMAKTYVVDKNDLTCPQNRPQQAVAQPKLPVTLPQQAVKERMELVSNDLKACYEIFGVGGPVPTDVVISPNGEVKHVKVAGDLAGTPTAECVERLVRNVTFPKFDGEDARLQWPFTLAD